MAENTSGTGQPGGTGNTGAGGTGNTGAGGAGNRGAGNTGAGGAAGTGDSRSTYEEFTVSGSELLGQVKRLLAEGSVRRVYLKKDGTTLLEVPLTAGVAVTAVTAVFAPVLVAVGAIAAMVSQVTIGVERQQPAGEDSDSTGHDGGDAAAGTALHEGPDDT